MAADSDGRPPNPGVQPTPRERAPLTPNVRPQEEHHV